MATHRGTPENEARYVIERYIGEGGYGLVGIAHDNRTNTKVAIKLLKHTASQLAVERFRREVEEVSKFNSPRIIRILDFNLQHSPPFYVMALHEKSLRDRLQELRVASQVLTPQATLQCLLAIIEGLEVAHLRGIYHRDLKPENILLDKNGDLVISDFGIGKFAHRQSMVLTHGGEFGTFDYCAPEQWETGDGSAPADVFALGIILFELMTGSRPGRTTNGIPPPSSVDSRIPKEVDNLFAWMVAPLGRRLDSCTALRVEIDGILERQYGVKKSSGGIGWGLAAAAGVAALALWGLSRAK